MPARFAALIAVTFAFGLFVPQALAAVPANGRSWELVTFGQPSSASPLGIRPLEGDGERVNYTTVGPPPGSPGGALFGFGLSERGPSGWVNTSLGYPYKAEFELLFAGLIPTLPIAYSDDGRGLWLASLPLTPDAPPPSKLALYRGPMGGAPELIATIGEGLTFLSGSYTGFADIADDGSRVVFISQEHLLPADAGRTEGASIYTWTGGGLRQVDVADDGTLLSTCGATVSPAQGMSKSGNRVFFTTPASCNGIEKVYLRDFESDTTVQISASECTRPDCDADADVSFAGATRNGEFAFLTTTQQLTDDDHDSGRDLYRYDADSGTLSLLSGAASEVGGAVNQALVFPAEAGERVYFRASGEIIPGEAPGGEKLFLADGTGLHLVAPASFPPAAEVQLSADGGRALFVTQTPLLGTDADNQNDAYLYDAEEEALTQVSVGPSGGEGADPVGIEAVTPLNLHEYEYGNLRPYWAIDAAGDRVFFRTAESLVPEDTNGVFDVYEWWHGELGLVTPGYQPLKSDFAGISRDGRTVMFATNATLVGADVDGDGRDVYAARLGGGFPEPKAAAACNSARCPLPTGQRLSRPTPRSMNTPRRRPGRLRVLEVAAKAKKGAVAVLVSVPAPGSVTGQIWAREGGRKVVLAAGATRATRAGKTQLSLRLTAAARRSTVGPRPLRLTVSKGSAKVSREVEVSLR